MSALSSAPVQIVSLGSSEICVGKTTLSGQPCSCSLLLSCYECTLFSLYKDSPALPSQCSVCKGGAYFYLGRCWSSCPSGTKPKGTGNFNRRCSPLVASNPPTPLRFSSVNQLSFSISGAALLYTDSILNPIVNEVTLMFRTSSPDGILLFAQSPYPSLVSDVFILELVGGNVAFSFDLGMGLSTLTVGTQNSFGYADNMWHTILVLRVGTEAILSVDGISVSGHAPSGSSTLQVGFLYVGYVSSNRTLTAKGYSGCLQQGFVDDYPLDIAHASSESGASPGICTSDACDSSPCAHGQCRSQNKTAYSCFCSLGYTGAQCNQTFDTCLDLSPCGSGGLCRSLPNFTYACDCLLGHAGPDCQYSKIGGPMISTLLASLAL